MMKWGGTGRKSSSSSSGSFSWLSKLKHMRIINSESSHAKMKHKENQKPIPSVNDIPFPPSCFDIGGRNSKKTGRRRSQSQGAIKLEHKDVVGLEDERTLLNDKKSLIQVDDEYDRDKEYENIRRRFEIKAQQVLEEQLLKLEREAKEVEELQYESPRTICTPRTATHSSASSNAGLNLKKISCKPSNHSENASSEKKQVFEKKKLKENEEIKEKIQEKQRRKPKKVSRVKIYSPRMISRVEISRIKALEEIRNKAKQKMKRERKEEIMEEISISIKPELDSFAVIKCSLNPKKDFRDSMIEMIEEKRISKAAEMEELLACYLTLNADEYHDMIIKVFRQVWFDMSQYGFGIN